MRIISPLAAAVLVLSAATFAPPANADAGDALIGGVFGFAAGTLFGNATARPRHYYYEPAPAYAPRPVVVYRRGPEPWTPEWYAYCGRKFDSFDAYSGTFLGYDGYRHMCY